MFPRALPWRGIFSPLGALAGSVVVACAVAPVVLVPVAIATPRTATVNTGAADLNVRAAPSAKSDKIGNVRNKSLVTIVCYVRGEPFSGGPYRLTTDIWNQLDTGGYVTDAMLNTGSNDPVVPLCAGENAPPPGPPRATGQTSAKNPADAGTPAWGAMAKWFQVSGKKWYPALSGLPREWANVARTTGWTVVEQPEPRSIVVFQPGVEGAPPSGHVAWVDTSANRRDGPYIGITEMHSSGDGLNTWTSREVRHRPGMSYILLP